VPNCSTPGRKRTEERDEGSRTIDARAVGCYGREVLGVGLDRRRGDAIHCRWRHDGRLASVAVLLATILTVIVVLDVFGSGQAWAGGSSTSSAVPSVVVTPASGLHDGQTLAVTVSHVPPGSTLLAAECSPRALEIGEDGCENHRNAVFFADSAGDAATRLDATSTISTAVGRQSCVPASCLVGVVRFTSPTAEEIVGVAGLHFSSTACRGGTQCEAAPPVPATVRMPFRSVTGSRGGMRITPLAPFSAAVVAGAGGDVASPTAITGPYQPRPATVVSAFTAGPPAVRGLRGEGLIALSMDGPGTDWASNADKAVVVSVRVDGRPWQQIVLFEGSTPFTYAGFVGPLRTGRHRVSVRVDTGRSTTGQYVPTVELYRVRLRVVAPTSSMYLLEKYAPVIYGRSDSASSDTQLLTYGTATALAGGATELSYVSVWSHEDAGTSFVPFLEWGEWGRMTDITGTVSLEVSPTGAISHSMYDWCGCQPGFPENRDSLLETSVPFHGRYFDGTHIIVRNASGNDYQSEVGSTGFRFQQAVVTGPSAGQPREAVMDAHPWTYQVMAQEVRSWYLDRSTAATSPQPGAPRQYAVVSLDTSVVGASAIAVALRQSGSATWYQSDMGSGAPLYTGGLGRTVIKLPVGWQRHTITGVRLRVYPAAATSSLTVASLNVLGLTARFHVVRIPSPSPEILPGTS